jgi:hypothetical protein
MVKPAPFRWGRVRLPRGRVTVVEGAPFASGMSFVNEGLFDNEVKGTRAKAVEGWMLDVSGHQAAQEGGDKR